MFRKLTGYVLLFWVAGVVFTIDLLSKYWIQHHSSLPLESYWPYGGYEIIPGFFYLAHVVNEGGAWGLLPGFRYGFIVLAVGALAAIFYFRREFSLRRSGMQFAFGLLTGGILGNLCDRIRFGHVVDFLDFHLPGYRWPAFNLADCGITVGVALYIICSLWLQRPEKTAIIDADPELPLDLPPSGDS